jgi:predicted RNA-binding Zn ribbon-like protein
VKPVEMPTTRMDPSLRRWLAVDRLRHSVLWRGTPAKQDLLVDYASLLAWSRRLELVDSADGDRLGSMRATRRKAASEAFDTAIAVREALHRTLVARIEGRGPAAADLDLLKGVFAESVREASLVAGVGNARWEWGSHSKGLGQPLWAISHDAVALLLDPVPARLGRCAASECGWLFIDASKNRSRRWCSMEGCGSRVKMRPHYARRHSGEAAY